MFCILQMKTLRHTELKSPAWDVISGKQEGWPVSQSTWVPLFHDLTIGPWQSPLRGFHLHWMSGSPETGTESYPFLYSQSLAQSMGPLTLKWNAIDSSYKGNWLRLFNTKGSKLRRWLPRSEYCRARHHLTQKGCGQTGTKQRQKPCRWVNWKTI